MQAKTESMVKARPIIFSVDSVQAIRKGLKTQTRRVVKPQPPPMEEVHKKAGIDFSIFTDQNTPGRYRVSGPVWAVRELMGTEPGWICRYGQPGSRLWVREPWIVGHRVGRKEFSVLQPSGSTDRDGKVFYRASFKEPDPEKGGRLPWRGARSMPRWASRITLEIRSIRVQRVQDISDEDAVAEGMPKNSPVMYADEPAHELFSAAAYRVQWDLLNGKRGFSWESNPFVWVVEFRMVKP